MAEFAVATDLVRKGCRVSYTHGLYKYDLIADKDDELLRVQVKKANKNEEKPWKYRLIVDEYEEGEVDIFAGYIVDEDEVFYVAFSDVGENNFRINTKSSDALNDHNAGEANLLEEYTLQRALRQHRNDATGGKQTEQGSSSPVEER
jgi:hypothetical protein